jgi:hypothetical protein
MPTTIPGTKKTPSLNSETARKTVPVALIQNHERSEDIAPAVTPLAKVAARQSEATAPLRVRGGAAPPRIGPGTAPRLGSSGAAPRLGPGAAPRLGSSGAAPRLALGSEAQEGRSVEKFMSLGAETPKAPKAPKAPSHGGL